MTHIEEIIIFLNKNIEFHELNTWENKLFTWKLNNKYKLLVNKTYISLYSETLCLDLMPTLTLHKEIILEFKNSIFSGLLSLIRYKGWRVAVHNDYSLNNKFYTFWLFTKGNIAIKGEGENDEEALLQVLERINEL